jgi:N-acetylglutamate synthase-like GNAT family acetyltransferase
MWMDGYNKKYTLKSLPFTMIFSISLPDGQQEVGVCGYNEYSDVIFLHSLAIKKKYLKKGYSRPFCEFVTKYAQHQKKILVLAVSIHAEKWLAPFYETMDFKYVTEEHTDKFNNCLEYKFPRLFSADELIWMFNDSHLKLETKNLKLKT